MRVMLEGVTVIPNSRSPSVSIISLIFLLAAPRFDSALSTASSDGETLREFIALMRPLWMSSMFSEMSKLFRTRRVLSSLDVLSLSINAVLCRLDLRMYLSRAIRFPYLLVHPKRLACGLKSDARILRCLCTLSIS